MADILSSINLGGMLSGAGGIVKSVLIGVFVFIIIGIVAYFAYRYWKNLTFYTTPVTLTRLMDNGMEKTRYDLKGGVFLNKGIKDFKVKIPKSKAHILGYIPDLSKSTTTDGRIHFITSGDTTIWQQVESKWETKEKGKDKEGHTFEYDLINKPVSRETKQLTVNAIQNWKDTIDKTKLTAFTIAIGAFIIMVIAHLISLYIQTKIKCGVAG